MNNKCPWCGSDKAQINLWLKDDFYTKEDFHICECLSCGLLYTMPRPDQNKIGEYYKSDEYLSHQENKKGFIPKLYEAVKKTNLKYKYNTAAKNLGKGKLLDIGCGVGDFIHLAETKGWVSTGVEPSETATNIAKTRIKAEILQSQDLENLPDESFDLITMWHVLEHVDNLKWQIEQLRRLIKPMGRIVIAIPNYKSFDAQHYKEHWAAYDVPRHLSHFSKETIAKIFKSNGLELKSTKKLKWDAYYISYMSEQYEHHALPLIKGTIKGFISNCKARRTGEWSSMIYIFEKNN